jgi:hypothetical protein
MALTDAKIRAAKPDEKPYKLADSGNMFCLFIPMVPATGASAIASLAKKNACSWCVSGHLIVRGQREGIVPKQIAEGIDPCEQKRAKKSVPDITHTFETIARQWHSRIKMV